LLCSPWNTNGVLPRRPRNVKHAMVSSESGKKRKNSRAAASVAEAGTPSEFVFCESGEGIRQTLCFANQERASDD
jgi:hypothetical protein